ncbi:hypothetical protein BZA77DRAFT_391243 [Pyronema omphalodes]|nr:hypothetical protein BZA77DRAFT_391243 [Pyronema omphalodes]
MATMIYQPSYDKQQIIDNCKYLIGSDIDPVVLTEEYEKLKDVGEYYYTEYGRQEYRTVQKPHIFVRAIVVDRMHSGTFFFSTEDSEKRALRYSSPTKGTVYMASSSECDKNYSNSAQCAIYELYKYTMELMKDKVDQEILLNNKLKEGVEEQLQRLTAETDVDDIFKEELRLKLYHRARASFERKEERLRNEIARKMQDMLDTLDEDEDDGEAAIDRIILGVQQHSKNTTSQNKVDWRGECVSNIVKDCQKKYRDKLKQQKEELTKKFEEEKKIAVQEAQEVADQKLAGILLEHESVEKKYDETIEGMKESRAHSDAEKDSSIRDLKQELDAKVQALEKACSSIEKEKGFRKKLEDALDVLHQTEMERKQELAEVKAELQRNLRKQRNDAVTLDETKDTDCDTVTEGSQYTPTASTIGASTADGIARSD